MKLSSAIRNLREQMLALELEALRDPADLLGVLANIVDGADIRKAFGAPGDWGYDTPLGDGVLEALNDGLLGGPVNEHS